MTAAHRVSWAKNAALAERAPMRRGGAYQRHGQPASTRAVAGISHAIVRSSDSPRACALIEQRLRRPAQRALADQARFADRGKQTRIFDPTIAATDACAVMAGFNHCETITMLGADCG
jgi:hypothetical protein